MTSRYRNYQRQLSELDLPTLGLGHAKAWEWWAAGAALGLFLVLGAWWCL